MLIKYFDFLQFLLEIQSCEKSDEDNSSGEKPKLTNYVICFLISSVIVVFLTKTTKIGLWDTTSTSLQYLFRQLKPPCDGPSNELSQSTFAYSDLLLFTSPLRILKNVSEMLSRIN